MNRVIPSDLLSVEQLLKMATPIAKLSRLLHADSDLGTAQTGFCYANLPHTAVLAMNRRWLKMASTSGCVSCILTTPEAYRILGEELGKPTLLLENADETFYYLHNQAIHEQTYPKGAWERTPRIAATASVDETAIVRGDVAVEDGVVIGPYSVVSGPARLGRDTVVHEHCTIGTPGLFTKKIAGQMRHVRHYGGVSVGERCQILAGANLARSAHLGCETTIEDEVSIGIRAAVGHDVTIGRETVVSTCAVISGRARVGRGCWIGAGALVSNSVAVGDRAKIRIGAAVIRDISEDADVSGNFARPHHETLKALLK
jgi:UDP-3-O-[3-hydroxymyristoyl] glucosamine N-acyltransferase